MLINVVCLNNIAKVGQDPQAIHDRPRIALNERVPSIY